MKELDIHIGDYIFSTTHPTLYFYFKSDIDSLKNNDFDSITTFAILENKKRRSKMVGGFKLVEIYQKVNGRNNYFYIFKNDINRYITFEDYILAAYLGRGILEIDMKNRRINRIDKFLDIDDV